MTPYFSNSFPACTTSAPPCARRIFRRNPHREYSLFRCSLVLLSIVATGLCAPLGAIESPGAPRALRFTWASNTTAGNADISLSQPALGRARENASADSELYFTRTARGTRNLWRAPIKFDATPVISPTDGNSADSAEVMPRPRTTSATEKPLVSQALTELAAPLFAENAVPLPNNRFLLCTTNAAGRPANARRAADVEGLDVTQRRQIARLDLRTGRFTALTTPETRSYSPTLSPDGRRLAFVVERAGLESIYIARLNESGAFAGTPRRAVAVGRRPTWLSNGALIFQSTRPGQQGLYQTSLRQIRGSEDAAPESVSAENVGAEHEPPSLLFARPGTSAVSPDGRHLCVAADGNQSAIDAGIPGSRPILPTLYWLAADGSGARLISSSEGAANPCFAPNGSALLYDAPMDSAASDNRGAASARRVLWIVPMLRVPPTAILSDVRAPRRVLSTRDGTSPWQEIEIHGTIFASGDDAPQVQLEWGEGSEPTIWNTFTGVRAPVHASTLAVWRMPASARGDWTLRLSVTDSSGDSAESILPVTLPLPRATSPDEAAPPVFARTNPTLPQVPATQGRLTAPNVTVIPGAPPAIAPALLGPRAPSSTQANSRPRPPRESRTPTIKPFDPSGGVRIPDQAATRQTTRPAQNLQIATLAGVAQALAALPPPAPKRPAYTPAPRRSLPMPPEAPPSVSAARAVPKATVPIAPAFPNRTAVNPQSASGSRDSTLGATVPQDIEGAGDLFPSPGGGPLPRLQPPPAQPDDPRSAVRPVAPRRSAPQDAARLAAPGRSRAGTSSRRDAPSRPQRSVRRRGDAAVVSASDLRSTVEAGSELSVSINMRNVGTRGWSSDDTEPVRLLVRWHDVTTSRRSRWEIKWLRADVAPGGSTQLSADITVPPRAGNFVLYLSLVRLNGSRYEVPSIDTSKDENEFGTVSYRVTVR